MIFAIGFCLNVLLCFQPLSLDVTIYWSAKWWRDLIAHTKTKMFWVPDRTRINVVTSFRVQIYKQKCSQNCLFNRVTNTNTYTPKHWQIGRRNQTKRLKSKPFEVRHIVEPALLNVKMTKANIYLYIYTAHKNGIETETITEMRWSNTPNAHTNRVQIMENNKQTKQKMLNPKLINQLQMIIVSQKLAFNKVEEAQCGVGRLTRDVHYIIYVYCMCVWILNDAVVSICVRCVRSVVHNPIQTPCPSLTRVTRSYPHPFHCSINSDRTIFGIVIHSARPAMHLCIRTIFP